jgi:hypothetical protein
MLLIHDLQRNAYHSADISDKVTLTLHAPHSHATHMPILCGVETADHSLTRVTDDHAYGSS